MDASNFFYGAVVLALVLSISPESAVSADKVGAVSQQRVIAEAEDGKNWLVNGRTFESGHHSPLTQVTDKNVGKLGLAWALDIDSPNGLVAEPIVVDGVIYLTAPFSKVYAVDAVSGKLIWLFDPTVRTDIGTIGSSWAVRVNRGVAVWDGLVYVGTGDCRLIAIDAATGLQRWESKVCDSTEAYGAGVTGAPRVGGGKVYIGYLGADQGVRGSIVAFDARSGKEVWRFWTVPTDPAEGQESDALEMAAKTWGNPDAWKNGGGTVWDGITYDPVTNLVYFGTDGALPMNAKTRDPKGGDNLFLCSIVAVNADTGEYVWHYQTTPKDAWNYAATMHSLVTELDIDGQRRRVVMQAPKNGFYYVLDARTGELLSAEPIAKVNWAEKIDLKTGRPVFSEAGAYFNRPNAHVEVWPGMVGAHNWHAMSYSPLTGLTYITSNELPSIFEAVGGAWGVRADLQGYPDGEVPAITGVLQAWDPLAGKARWTVPLALPYNGGVLSTAGNLVFLGTAGGDFSAYAADTGQRLWNFKTGTAIQSAPVSFSVAGEQYVVIPAGWGGGTRLFSTSLSATADARGPSRLLAFKLNSNASFDPPAVVENLLSRPPEFKASEEVIARGEALWVDNTCEICHGLKAEGMGGRELDGSVPDLRYMTEEVRRDFYGIVLGGLRKEKGMPGFGEWMSLEDAEAVYDFILSRTWKLYNEQQKAAAAGQD